MGGRRLLNKYPSLRVRPRRQRKMSSLRRMVCETRVTVDDLIMPFFLVEGQNIREPIAAMPGQFRLSTDQLLLEAERAWKLGIPSVMLFPVIPEDLKDSYATESTNIEGLLPRAILRLKQKLPDLVVISDVAMDPYSSDGHDGIVEGGEILNDPTLEVLAQMALTQARVGADFVAPSDMMDGRVGVLRETLDEHGFEKVGIISYSAKYASSFYGPFRTALDSAPKKGDKKTYQMDPSNQREALREVGLDVEEGADMVIIKPALSYLDVISRVKQECQVPVLAYNVSGEYAMVKAAAAAGYLDESLIRNEILLSIKRAGADIIISYFAMEFAQDFAQGT